MSLWRICGRVKQISQGVEPNVQRFHRDQPDDGGVVRHHGQLARRDQSGHVTLSVDADWRCAASQSRGIVPGTARAWLAAGCRPPLLGCVSLRGVGDRHTAQFLGELCDLPRAVARAPLWWLPAQTGGHHSLLAAHPAGVEDQALPSGGAPMRTLRASGRWSPNCWAR